MANLTYSVITSYLYVANNFLPFENSKLALIQLLFLDSMEVKPVTTRKLRRRPHDPPPIANKVGRKNGVSTLNLILSESEICEDLNIITKGKGLSSTSLKKSSKDL